MLSTIIIPRLLLIPVAEVLADRTKKNTLGRVSATLRIVSIASGAAGEMLFGVLNDATWAWLPIFLGTVGVFAASLLFKSVMGKIE